jgi:hypothetical protein
MSSRVLPPRYRTLALGTGDPRLTALGHSEVPRITVPSESGGRRAWQRGPAVGSLVALDRRLATARPHKPRGRVVGQFGSATQKSVGSPGRRG